MEYSEIIIITLIVIGVIMLIKNNKITENFPFQQKCINELQSQGRSLARYPLVKFHNFRRERRMFDSLTYDLLPYTSFNSRLSA